MGSTELLVVPLLPSFSIHRTTLSTRLVLVVQAPFSTLLLRAEGFQPLEPLMLDSSKHHMHCWRFLTTTGAWVRIGPLKAHLPSQTNEIANRLVLSNLLITPRSPYARNIYSLARVVCWRCKSTGWFVLVHDRPLHAHFKHHAHFPPPHPVSPPSPPPFPYLQLLGPNRLATWAPSSAASVGRPRAARARRSSAAAAPRRRRRQRAARRRRT